jgi:hypothetical protein
MDQSIIRKEDLEKIWSDGKQNPKELPITITIFPIPGFGINTEAVRKTIMSAFSNKQLTEKTKILTVKECIEKDPGAYEEELIAIRLDELENILFKKEKEVTEAET